MAIEKLEPVQKKFKKLRGNEAELRVILSRGREQAKRVADQTLFAAKQKMGLI